MTSALRSRHVFGRGKVDGAVHRLVERLGHVFGRMRGDDGLTRARRRDRDEPGAGAQRALRGQHGGAGLAARAGDDQHAAEIALVRIRRRAA